MVRFAKWRARESFVCGVNMDSIFLLYTLIIMVDWLRNTLLILATCYFDTVECFSFLHSHSMHLSILCIINIFFSDCKGEKVVDQQSGHVTALEGGL